MTMPSTSRTKPRVFTEDPDDDDAFSKLASRPSKLPPVEPKSLSRPPTMVPRPTTTNKDNDNEEDDDDYMSMTLPAPLESESSLQRLKRRKLEASVRGHPPSKAEIASQAKITRDIGLATNIINNSSSKGLKMMKAMGYSAGSALGKAPPPAPTTSSTTDGKEDHRRLEPIKPILRESRTGIGHESDLKRKLGSLTDPTEEKASVKRRELSPESYRNRLTQEAQQRRYEAQIFAAQSICEKLVAEDPPGGYDGPNKKDAEGGEATEDKKEEGSSKPDFFSGAPTFTQIKQINLIYRGFLYKRALSDLKASLKRQEHENLMTSKSSHIPSLNLPTYNATGELSKDDKIALSLDVNDEDGDEEQEWEDKELEEFEKREAKDRLDEIVRYLRSQWRYCFWCKARYTTDQELETECPGPTEEDHD